MKHTLLICALVLAALSPVTSDVLYDAGVWGAVLRPNSSLEALVQPFQTRMSGWANRIGVAIASGADPNHVGLKVALTDTDMVVSIPGTAIAGSWNVLPVSGAALVYAYFDIQPVFLDANKIYGLLIEPGDAEMFGSVAYTWLGGEGWGTSDGWETSFRLSYPTAIRVYGTAVPEPSSASVLAFAVISIATRTFRRTKKISQC